MLYSHSRRKNGIRFSTFLSGFVQDLDSDHSLKVRGRELCGTFSSRFSICYFVGRKYKKERADVTRGPHYHVLRTCAVSKMSHSYVCGVMDVQKKVRTQGTAR